MKGSMLALVLSVLLVGQGSAQLLPYQLPPRPLVALADAPSMPQVGFSPNGEWLLQLDMQERPTLLDQSQPELRLAGLHLNPAVSSTSRPVFAKALHLRRLPQGSEISVRGLPANARISHLQWSPDNTKLAFTHTTRNHLELWVLDITNTSALARLVPNLYLNGVLGQPFEWVSDSKTLIVRAVVGGRGPAPVRPAPTATTAAVPPRRTDGYPLKTPLDEQLLNYYALSQVVRVGLDDRMAPLGQPGLIAQAVPSPDGRFVLIRTYRRPYPPAVPLVRFPQRVQVLSLDGMLDKQIADLPAALTLPAGPDAVPLGSREFSWRADAPNTLFWVEARDGGDPATPAPVRDVLLVRAAPFEESARELAALPLRFRRIYWSSEQLALIEGADYAPRKRTIWTLDLATKTSLLPLLEMPAAGAAGDPATTPMLRRNAQGCPVLLTDATGNVVYLAGTETTAEHGDQPLLNELNVRTRKTTPWWRSEAPYYEQPICILDPARHIFITRRESVQSPPNYHLRTGSKLLPLTQFASPYADLDNRPPRQQQLRYQLADGLVGAATLYLPADFQKADGPRPTILETVATPAPDSSVTGLRGSRYAFTRYGWGSPLYWTAQGYAVLQIAALPGPEASGGPAAAATYARQLVRAGKGALAEAQRLGVDTARVSVLGRGRGAFPAATLLAGSRLFKTGIVLTGLHNQLLPARLTGEELPLATAPDWYDDARLAPFSLPDTLRRPLLVLPAGFGGLPAGFAARTEQLYSALQKPGSARVSYGSLPGEAHGYTARESLTQLLAEMNTWLETYLKSTQATLPSTLEATYPAN